MTTRKDFLLRSVGFLIWSWVALTAGVAHGVEIEAEFNAGVGKSDNIERTAEDEIEETIGVAGLRFALTEETNRFYADIRSRFDYLHYQDGTFDNELIGGLVGVLEFELVEERLLWIIQNNFGQQLQNQLQPARPDNRENVNFFTTGPTLSLLPGSRNLVEIDLRYSSVDYEERDTDNVRKTAALRIGREIRRGATLSLNAMAERVEFDNDGLSPDFDRVEGYLRYEVSGSRNAVSLDLGYTEVDVEGEKGDGTLARLSWTREISSGASFGVFGGTNYSDQGNIFRSYQEIMNDPRDTTDVIDSTEPFTNDFFRVFYSLEGDRTSVNFDFDWSREDYSDAQPIDRDLTMVTLRIRRDISRSVYTRLELAYRERDFKELAITDDDTSVSVEFGYRFTPAFETSLQYRYLERSTTNSTRESRENRLFLRFFYTPEWGR